MQCNFPKELVKIHLHWNIMYLEPLVDVPIFMRSLVLQGLLTFRVVDIQHVTK